MKNQKLAIILIFITLAIAGCSSSNNAADSKTTAAANQPINSSKPQAIASNTVEPVTTPASQNSSKSKSNTPVNKAPATQIGSGGSDLFIFTQARSALDSDVELRSARVIVEVKEGVITLSGTVPNSDQKMKAEHLLANMNGVKSVRNQIKIVNAKQTDH